MNFSYLTLNYIALLILIRECFLESNVNLEKTHRQINESKTVVFRLPDLKIKDIQINQRNLKLNKLVKICNAVNYLTSDNTLTKDIFFIGPLHLLAFVYHSINEQYNFQYLVAIRTKSIRKTKGFLPNEHLGVAIFSTRKAASYSSVKQKYQFCKCCGKTLKDYGGKTHLLNADGTRMSDVWKDFVINENEKFPQKILKIIKKLTKTPNSKLMKVSLYDIDKINKLSITQSNFLAEIVPKQTNTKSIKSSLKKNRIYNSDVLEGLAKIPDRSIDLALVDPPYNLDIKYGKISDLKDNSDYITWMMQWTKEISRTLKDGGVICLVNIPQWTLEIFPSLLQNLKYRGWVVWDAWSVPNRTLIPAHYPILCFSKGNKIKSLNLKPLENSASSDLFDVVHPLNYGYCVRSACLNKRTEKMKNDRKLLTDLWHDIHRIRHNSFRYNHPTLMPQKLAKRIINIFSKPGDVVLDCFNGVGTTTLVAEKLHRNYVGIEKSPSYYNTSLHRHFVQSLGKDPFDKQKAGSTSTQKGYRKVKHQKQVQKKTLQLEVKRVAEKLGRCPTEKELVRLGEYPLKLYYDNFRDWAEITVATRRTGLKIKSFNR